MALENGFQRSTFAKLSPHPYLLANLQTPPPGREPSRANGRTPRQARTVRVKTGSLTHAHGSATVRVGDTTVVCGVRAETVLAAQIPNFRPADRAAELRDYDLLVPNIELNTGSAPQFLPGAPPSALAQTLSTRVYSLLHDSEMLDVEDFRIWYTKPADDIAGGDEEDMEVDDDEGGGGEGERVVIAYWVLYLDMFFISYDGNPFDAAWAGLLAALRNAKLPRAYWDPDREMVLCARGEDRPLSLRGLPVPCTAAVFAARDADRPRSADDQFWVLVDPDRLEEDLCDEAVTAVVDRTGGETKVLSVSKHGGTALSPALLREFMGVAERRWDEVGKALAK